MKKVKIKRIIKSSIKSALPLTALALLAVSSILFYPSEKHVSVNSPVYREIPIYSVKRDDKKVSLSFDAAWGNEDTGVIMEILKKYGVHVTFFMTGGWIKSYPEDVKAILAAGHDLGNHSENHKEMNKLSMSECQKEIMEAHNKVEELTGYNMCLFRPPYGAYNDTLIDAAKNCGYYTIQWSVDSLDWKDYGADNIVKTVLNHKNLKDGAIILMHNGAKYTKDALERVIVGLKEKGYEIVPVSEIIYTDNYEINHAGEQIKV